MMLNGRLKQQVATPTAYWPQPMPYSPLLSGGLSFRLGCTVHHVVCVAKIISKAQRFSGYAFLAEVTELVLEPHATAREFELDESLSNQKAMNRSQLWQLFKDCQLTKSGTSLIQMDRAIGEAFKNDDFNLMLYKVFILLQYKSGSS